MIKLKKMQLGIEPIYDSDYYNPTSQLIQIPSSAKDRCDQGIIKYMGAECDPALKIGDHVIFSGYSGTTVGIDNGILIIIHSDFIKAVVDDDMVEINGLYHLGLHGIYFPATYDSAMRFISDSLNSIIKIKPDERKEQRDEFDERHR